jgi:2-furoyl-CoA dehydrogenase FAD binding subunit
VKPRPFDYVRPDTVEEALEVLAEHGDDARVLAGGQTLIAMLNLRVVEPAVLVDITRIPELGEICERPHPDPPPQAGEGSPHPNPPPQAGEGTEREQAGEGEESPQSEEGKRKVEVGAAVTQSRLMAWPALAQRLPLLAAALPFVGHFQTRNKGTVCGSVAHADPSSEIPLSLALLQGEVVLRSRRGTRVLPAHAFQLGMLATAREPDELITAVRFPVSSGGVAFREVARRHGDFAIVAVAALAERDGSIRLGVAGLADRPAVRRIAAGGAPEMREAIGDLAWELEGYEDIHASARMRRDLLRRIGPVVAEEARRCAA